MNTNTSHAADVSRAATALGRTVSSAEQVAGSVANLDLLLRLDDDGSVIMKVAPVDELRREVWVCRRLVGAGLPVPEVLAHDLDHDRPFLIMDVVPGAASDAASVATEAGRVMRTVHDVELDGFGLIDLDGERVRGRYASWAESLAAEAAGAGELVAAGLLDAEVAGRAVSVATGPLTRYDGAGVLLHRDLKVQHLFGLDGRLTSIIDWGDAAAGDPAYDLARLSMAGESIMAAFGAGYGRPAPSPDRLAAYRVALSLAAMIYELRAGGDWFDVYRGRLLDDLRRLDPLRSATSGPPAVG